MSQRVRMAVRVSMHSVSAVKGSMRESTVKHVSLQDSAPLLQLPMLLTYGCPSGYETPFCNKLFGCLVDDS